MRIDKQKELDNYINSLKTIKMEYINNQGNFITTEKYKCYLNNDKVITREKILKNKNDGSAVIVLPVTKDGEVILTIQPRVFTKTTVGIGLPAGYVEKDEDYENAAKRELLEETGYSPEELIELCSYYQDDGCSGAFNKGYLARNCKKITTQHLDKDEFIKYFKCNIDELYELLDKGYISDGGSQLVIEKSKTYLKKRGN